MSVEAMAYVLNEKVGDSTRKLVLLAFANHAHKDGTAAYCGVSLVADYAECSPRTVQRHVPLLVAGGWMREGDQRLVAHLPHYSRPIVYDLSMTPDQRAQWAAEAAERASEGGRRAAATAQGAEGGRRAAEVARRNSPQFSQVEPGDILAPGPGDSLTPGQDDVLSPPPGVTGGTPPVTPMTGPGDTGGTLTVLDPSDEPSLKTFPSPAVAAEGTSKRDVDLAFERFYAAYPRKTGRQDARKAFEQALKHATADTLVAGAVRFANDPNLPPREEAQFIAHPATWLRQGRWDDEPLPPRIQKGSRLNPTSGLSHDKHEVMSELARQYQEQVAAEAAEEQRRLAQ